MYQIKTQRVEIIQKNVSIIYHNMIRWNIMNNDSKFINMLFY